MLFKQFMAFLKKEFYHVIRDKKTLLIMFAMPLMQIIIFGYAITNEVKNADIVIVNPNNNALSQQLITKIKNSAYFTIVSEKKNTKNLDYVFRSDKAAAAIIFPNDFMQGNENNNTLQIVTDGINPNLSKTIINYLNAIIADFSIEKSNRMAIPLQISTNIRMLYNPEMKSVVNTIPGIMALIMLIICTTLTSVSIVREKEYGSMEVLLVSPFKPVLVLLAKSMPYFLLSFLDIIFILFLSRYVLGVHIIGNVFLLLFISSLFIITSLALGLLISNLSSSQITAMLVSMVGMFMPTILFTGFMFPLENMPVFFQWFSNIVPSKWFYIAAKDIMLKGLPFIAIWKESLILACMAIVLLFFSLKKFNIRLQS